MGRRDKKDKKGKKHHDHPPREEAEVMDEENVDPDDIQPADLDEEEDRPGFAAFVYNNIFFEWFYRVSSSYQASTQLCYWR